MDQMVVLSDPGGVKNILYRTEKRSASPEKCTWLQNEKIDNCQVDRLDMILAMADW